MTDSENKPSLPEVYRSIPVPNSKGFWRKMVAYAGSGYLVSVGYMNSGNWPTNLAGGAKFGYALLSVILLSNLMAILLQSLCVGLGVVTGRDLAQACRDYFSPRVSFLLWILCEIAISACDLAELVGSAIGLQLLFGGVAESMYDKLIMLSRTQRIIYLILIRNWNICKFLNRELVIELNILATYCLMPE
jgi:manganese transport protein